MAFRLASRTKEQGHNKVYIYNRLVASQPLLGEVEVEASERNVSPKKASRTRAG